MRDPLDSDLWFPAEPGPVTPVPAATVDRLRGQRVITGTPATGWRYDLRADDPVDQNGTRLVPVLIESDYYRAELDQIEVFAPLVPVDHVWVEHTDPVPPPLPDPPARSVDAPANPPDLLSRLVPRDRPPTRVPVSARDATGLTGRRVVVVSRTSQRRDLRACTEPYENADGTICVRIAPEPTWYHWALTGQLPTTSEVPVYLIWVE